MKRADPPTGDGAVTRLLARAAGGDERAGEDALRRVYDELRAIATSYLRRERDDHTLQPTALVHEAWLPLAAPGEDGWEDRRQFIGCASHVMRQILVAHARGRGRIKRGGDRLKLTLDPNITPPTTDGADPPDLLALDEAMTALAALHERKARLVELRSSSVSRSPAGTPPPRPPTIAAAVSAASRARPPSTGA